MPGARDLARSVLRRVRREDAYASLSLAAALRGSGLPPEERALATELVYGVLRHQRRLDHALARHATRPLRKVDPEVLDLMRLAAYQALLLDRVPAHAAVDHAVGAVRRTSGARVAGFANAVLRKLTIADLTRDLPEDAGARLAVEGSLPDELARYLVRRLGPGEAGRLAHSLLDRAPVTLRVNTLRTEPEALAERLRAEGVEVRPGRLAASALRVVGSAVGLFELRTHAEGLWSVQDEAAQLVGLALAPRPGETVLDACAGLGGKAMHLAALLENRGLVLCADVNPRKLELLEETAARLGVTCCVARQADARSPAPHDGRTVDRVLVDAPCTGLGVLRRHPELKWRRGAGLAALPELVALQRELLEAALAALRPGGVLVYSVCTLTAEEGPEQLDGLLGAHPELEPDPLPEVLGAIPQRDPRAGVLALWPHEHEVDGFFIARMRKVQ